MIAIEDKTCWRAFSEAAARWPDLPCLCAPTEGAARVLTFAETLAEAERIAAAFRAAGYGLGHRVAVALGTGPEHYLVKLALNALGVSMVPVNPDYRASEIEYLFADSGAALGLTFANRIDWLATGATGPVVDYHKLQTSLPTAPTPARPGEPGPATEASLLYTSGTTGRPKGCVLSHEYELMCGEAYRNIREPIALREGEDRVFNPLPAFHVNAGVITFWGAILTGCCLIQPERFSAGDWWRQIQSTEATVFHYLGVVISVLLADREAGAERLGALRVGLGAGVEPALHREFEERFGVPLIECWGMTEMCRVLVVDEEPRMIDTRAMGRPRPDLEVRVVDRDGADVAPGEPGEMLIRHSAATPRKGFFSGYLNKPDATAEAWEGGWFHTGDTVTQDETGMVFFVDRAKNIIRRAGENIAAAEVENVLFEDDRVVQVACVAAPDEVREEEVMACIVLAEGVARSEATARSLFDHCFEKMAYFKPPGWVLFVDELPVTGTQKVVKHRIFEAGEDPRRRAGAFDFRGLKRRG